MKYLICFQNAGHCMRAATVMVVIVLSILITSCDELERMRHPNLDLEIHGPVTIADEWLEITPREPLKAEREVNEIVLWFAERTKVSSHPSGIVGKEGVVFEPEVEIADQHSKIYTLTEAGLDEKGIAYGWFGEDNSPYPISLPKNRTYTKLRLKSVEPISCSSVVWRNNNPRDFK